MTDKKKTAFEKALTDAVLARYQKTLAEDSGPVELSDSYKKAVEELTGKTERKTWKYVNKTWKRILIAAILMFLLAATAVAAVPALREGLIRFFMHDNGVAYTFEFTQEDLDRAPKEIETYRMPSYVPIGFIIADQTIQADAFNVLYFNDAGDTFDYSQMVLWTYESDYNNPSAILNSFVVNSENVVIESVVLQGYEVKVIHNYYDEQKEDTVALFTDHQYFYEIGAPNLSFADIDAIIASINTVNPS